MSAWIQACALVLAVNGVRAVRDRRLAAVLSGLPWVGVLAGGGTVLLPSAVAGSVATILWRRWVIEGGAGTAVCGMLALGLSVGAGFLALGTSGVDPWVVVALAVLLLAEPSTRILVRGMGLAGKQGRSAPESPGRGEAIGILERWLLFVLVLRGDYTALAFLVAAKSLVRHDRFSKDPDFAEYFLVGTLGSILLAVIVAEGTRKVLGI